MRSTPINTAAVIEAVLRAAKSLESPVVPDWIAIGRAVRDNPDAWDEVYAFTDSTDTDDLLMLGFGFGMVAGMMYSTTYGHDTGAAVPHASETGAYPQNALKRKARPAVCNHSRSA